MARYYFTYAASDRFPFIGGWTEVEAPDMKAAVTIYRIYHPGKVDGLINCSFVYPEENFFETQMPARGNFGNYCHEKISITREVMTA